MKLLAGLALVAACADPLPREERELAAMPNLTTVIDVDVGVPQDPLGTPSDATGLSVFIDYPDDDVCYSLHATASALVDGIVPDTFLPGGFEDETYCAKPAIYTERLPPRDVSTITLEDHSAAYSIHVARLFVNPPITLPATLAPGPVVARVADPRAIASATVWWRSADQSWMKPVDVSTHGELRFAIPAETRGAGTLGITLTIRDNDVSCTGFASCKAIVRGGGAFAVTVN